ncbi:MAG: hypothetical protein EHM34_07190, partial [Nitrosopumilales archaeon]
MPYNYFLSGSPTFFKSNKENWIDDFTQLFDDSFTNASDVFVIQEETLFASGAYADVTVRVNTAINNETGRKLGDDFKILLFQSSHADVSVGQLFQFDNSYWLIVNANSLKSLAVSAMARRCNNRIRWSDTNGITYSVPCIIDYSIATPDNKNRTDPLIGEGTIKVFAQLNDTTRT